MIPDARQILDPAATNQNHGMLLKVVPDAGDVSRHFDTGGQPHTGDFPQCGVRLFRR
jgi:hypothetical protein